MQVRVAGGACEMCVRLHMCVCMRARTPSQACIVSKRVRMHMRAACGGTTTTIAATRPPPPPAATLSEFVMAAWCVRMASRISGTSARRASVSRDRYLALGSCGARGEGWVGGCWAQAHGQEGPGSTRAAWRAWAAGACTRGGPCRILCPAPAACFSCRTRPTLALPGLAATAPQQALGCTK